MDTLRLGWEQLLTNLKRAINEVEVQIMAREAHNISEAQMNDFRRCFNHFDRRRLRRLDLSEFKACLVSLGYNIPNNPEGDADFRRILASVDPSGSGVVTYESFIRFMTQQASDSESAEQLIDSFRVLANEQDGRQSLSPPLPLSLRANGSQSPGIAGYWDDTLWCQFIAPWPFVTEETIRRELPPEQAEYCLQKMKPYKGESSAPGALDYTDFSNKPTKSLNIAAALFLLCTSSEGLIAQSQAIFAFLVRRLLFIPTFETFRMQSIVTEHTNVVVSLIEAFF
ncbi:unnamed protein product [Rodentolepis nana]|uniref:EF-hand domain-containing protein n=1 Tax=Rodentolepis nana TaxID=102285 RepID=A0A158QII7_RODNA|nr:unnamed protein product [Rodentolepis nana]